MHKTPPVFKEAQEEPGPARANGMDVLQVNMGYVCNMSCRHCHVRAGPLRAEAMGREVVEDVLRAFRENEIGSLDITGGAPEMNPNFRHLVTGASGAGRKIILRSNLTVFFEEGMDDVPEFLRENGVDITASLPCYMEENVDSVRGKGAFKKSIEALRRLNLLGYGRGGEAPALNLVFNPSGAFLPPPREALEADYKRALKERFGVSFDRLFVFANMPLGRFGDSLEARGGLEDYMALLKRSFNPLTLEGIMCRRILSVGWDGGLYDCDFNQMAGVGLSEGLPRHIREFDYGRLSGREISMGGHCFGCTAGRGFT